ncbi:MAG: NAD(P)H-hydrate epimerase [Candidatus Dormibacteraeota bacterium]|nr:NAD(P)H-hydrate epimerase [Candidatus Dormibacteraeota bacterium]
MKYSSVIASLQTTPSRPARVLPTLSSAQVAEVDRLAIERYGLAVSWLMEAAGWQLARHCRGTTYVVCGPGNNGGDGLAAARHLHRWGRLAGVALAEPDRIGPLPAEQLRALRALGVSIDREPRWNGARMVLDALFGTGLHRAPEGRLKSWIEAINGAGLEVVAADLPSGLDADSGAAPGVAVDAATTVTLGLPKAGLLTGRGPELAGDVWLADIGIPFAAYAAVGAHVPPHLFAIHDRLQLSALRL